MIFEDISFDITAFFGAEIFAQIDFGTIIIVWEL
jgi:hypothetical protein